MPARPPRPIARDRGPTAERQRRHRVVARSHRRVQPHLTIFAADGDGPSDADRHAARATPLEHDGRRPFRAVQLSRTSAQQHCAALAVSTAAQRDHKRDQHRASLTAPRNRQQLSGIVELCRL